MRRLVPCLALLLLAACGDAGPPPGKRYDVGGFSLHLLCSGDAVPARPTVIIEGGGGVPAIGNVWLQRGLEKSVRVCTYDRAGMGWSDASDAAHDAETGARQLHRLLEAAHERPPYVFAGHSIGGLYQTAYVKLYPDQVVGLAYLDSSYPGQFQRTPGVDDAMRRKGVWLSKALGVYTALGLMHVYNFNDAAAAARFVPRDVADRLALLATRSKQSFAMAAELAAFDESGREVAQTGLGDRPVVAISAGSDGVGDDAGRARLQAFSQMHDEWAARSTRGRHVTIAGATHMSLILDRTYADQAVAEILRVVDEAR